MFSGRFIRSRRTGVAIAVVAALLAYRLLADIVDLPGVWRAIFVGTVAGLAVAVHEALVARSTSEGRPD